MSDIDLDEANRQEVTLSLPTPRKPTKDVPPQESIDTFWKKFTTKQPGKAFTILPENFYARRAAIQASRKTAPPKNAEESYNAAKASCKAKVDKIANDCRRLNQKYKDPHFDIEFDYLRYQWGQTEDCLVTLGAEDSGLRPMSVRRVEDIFDDPHFYIDGMTASEWHQ